MHKEAQDQQRFQKAHAHNENEQAILFPEGRFLVQDDAAGGQAALGNVPALQLPRIEPGGAWDVANNNGFRLFTGQDAEADLGSSGRMGAVVDYLSPGDASAHERVVDAVDRSIGGLCDDAGYLGIDMNLSRAVRGEGRIDDDGLGRQAGHLFEQLGQCPVRQVRERERGSRSPKDLLRLAQVEPCHDHPCPR